MIAAACCIGVCVLGFGCNPNPGGKVELGVKDSKGELAEGSNLYLGSCECGSTLEENFEISNKGDIGIEITGIDVGGSGFELDTSYNGSLGVGETKNFSVKFVPFEPGEYSGEVKIHVHELSEPFSFSVSGSGSDSSDGSLESDLQLKQNGAVIDGGSSFDFGSEIEGNSKEVTFTIENIGTKELTLTGSPLIALQETDPDWFTVTQQPSATVAAGNSTSFTIQMMPQSTGVKSATVMIPNNEPDSGDFAFTIEGTGTDSSEPEMNIQSGGVSIPDDTGNYDFSDTVVNSNNEVVFTIENLGSADLTLGVTPLVDLSGTDAAMFSVTAQPTSPVSVGGTTTFTVQFSPASTGTKSATISIDNNDGDENPYDFTITGNGVAPEMNVKQGSSDITDDTGSYALANTSVGLTSEVEFQIENTGSAALTLSGTPLVDIRGTDATMFSVINEPASTVATSDNTTFSIQFEPTSGGTKNATVSIANNDSDENPYDFSISGDAYVPDITLEGSGPVTISEGDTVDFGTWNNKETKELTFWIRNTGETNSILDLGNSPVYVSGTDHLCFEVVQPSSTTVSSGDYTTFTVTFTPGNSGENKDYAASVSVESNDPDENPYAFNLTASTYYQTYTTYGSTGNSEGDFSNPYDVVYNRDNVNKYVYVADDSRGKVLVFNSSTGSFVKEFGSDNADYTDYLAGPEALDVDSNGNIYVVNQAYYPDADFRHIHKFTADGIHVSAWGANGTGDEDIDSATGVAIGPDSVTGNEAVFVADNGNQKVKVFSTDGTYIRSWSVTEQIRDIEVFPGGRVLVATPDSYSITSFNNSGTAEGSFGFFSGLTHIEIRNDYNYVYGNSTDGIKIYSSTGDYKGIISYSSYSPSAPFENPMGMSYGDNGCLYFVNWDVGNPDFHGPNLLVKMEYLP
jgi:hypothetical protein